MKKQSAKLELSKVTVSTLDGQVNGLNVKGGAISGLFCDMIRTWIIQCYEPITLEGCPSDSQ